jgi:hypothetical protein
MSATPGSPTKPLRDPIAPPERDPADQPMHDPPGDPTFEPPQPLTEPTPNPASDPPPEMPGDPPQMLGRRRGFPAGRLPDQAARCRSHFPSGGHCDPLNPGATQLRFAVRPKAAVLRLSQGYPEMTICPELKGGRYRGPNDRLSRAIARTWRITGSTPLPSPQAGAVLVGVLIEHDAPRR